MQIKIVLIGTVHDEPQGPKRLKSVLEKVNPDAVAIEDNEDDIKNEKLYNEMRKNLMNEWEEILIKKGWPAYAIDRVRPIRTAYETPTCVKYCNDKSIPILFTDIEQRDETFRKDWKRLIGLAHTVSSWDSDFEKRLLHTKHEKDRLKETSDISYGSLLRCLRGEMSPFQIHEDFKHLNEGVNVIRDPYMAENMMRFYSSGKYSCIAWVGGGGHIIEDLHAKSLYSRLKHLNPERRVIAFPNLVF